MREILYTMCWLVANLSVGYDQGKVYKGCDRSVLGQREPMTGIRILDRVDGKVLSTVSTREEEAP